MVSNYTVAQFRVHKDTCNESKVANRSDEEKAFGSGITHAINILKEILEKDLIAKVVKSDPLQLQFFSSETGLMTFMNLFSEFNMDG